MSSGEIGAGAGSPNVATNTKSYTVPLRFGETTPSEGTITYKADKATLDTCEGFFVFTYYIRNPLTGEETHKQSAIYLEGLHAYMRILLTKDPNPFKSWKLIIYTDQYTYDEMSKVSGQKPVFDEILERKKEEKNDNEESPFTSALAEYNTIKISQMLLRSKNVIFSIVTWPKHQRNSTIAQVNGPALRLIRVRAPFDFPNQYCFTRDADTLFEKDITDVIENNIFGDQDYQRVRFVKRLYVWEKTFFEMIPSIEGTIRKSPLILGTEEKYVRNFHANKLKKLRSPFGVYAGFTNTTPGIDLYSDLSIWNKILDYINMRSYKKEFKRYPIIEHYLNEAGTNTETEIQKAKNRGMTTQEYFGFSNTNIQDVKGFYPNLQKNEKYQNYIDILYSNNSLTEKIGRDEQALLFIIIPRAFDNVFFFNVTYSDYVKHTAFFPSFSDKEMEDYGKKSALPELNIPFHEIMKKTYEGYSQVFLETFQGGKRKKRKTVRLKIEKRKTRRRS